MPAIITMRLMGSILSMLDPSYVPRLTSYVIKLSVVSSTDDTPSDPLERYRAKRSADRTPEPSGRVAADGGRLYIMHKHAASSMHFDLRLEFEGTLKSWAV